MITVLSLESISITIFNIIDCFLVYLFYQNLKVLNRVSISIHFIVFFDWCLVYG